MKTSTVLFLLYAAKGHYYPSFKIARAFKSQGFEVVYASLKPFESFITDQGFKFIELEIKLFTSLKDEIQGFNKSLLQIFFNHMLHGKRKYSQLNLAIAAYKRKIESINPQIIFIDSYLALNATFLSHLNIRIISFNTQISSEKRRGIPPINSSYTPLKNRFLNNMVTALLWQKYFTWRFINDRIIERFFLFGYDRLSLLLKIGGKHGAQVRKRIITNKFYYGLSGIEEISFVPGRLDFVNDNSALFNSVSMVEHERNDKYDRLYEILKNQILEYKALTQWPIVYCCLGTVSRYHSNHCSNFLKKLIKAFESQERILVISTGKSQSLNYLLSMTHQYPNVFVSGHLPQLDILNHVDVMISHGGINSIMECISKEIPMIVYPLSSLYDQKGNAARVIYHGLGLRGKLKSETSKGISKKINTILQGMKFYKKNLKTFNAGLSYQADIFGIVEEERVYAN